MLTERVGVGDAGGVDDGAVEGDVDGDGDPDGELPAVGVLLAGVGGVLAGGVLGWVAAAVVGDCVRCGFTCDCVGCAFGTVGAGVLGDELTTGWAVALTEAADAADADCSLA